ncbi:the major facilitator superfamily permease [Talaromyces pinophilus]|uniref:The major facilitator superfamily permease n=1 Tax=Talaromyces pinophilus TaxID=128442 RepID=A0A0B8MXK1_TALPI|nr:the major facilitator superfamily permease [Talaromyces pinophilus]
MSFFGQICLVAQPVVLSYRTSTLYGAAEQAVGGAAAVASLSIASIIGPQMYPNSDAPQYLAGFIATCALLGVCILTYLTLPYWLYYEARTRKRKTGHALPLTAIEDAEISHISAAALTRIHEVNEHEEQASEKNAAEKGNEEGQRTVNHVESV